MDVNISSEFGKLEGVILHTPGAEVQNMTPENAQRALYSDILNLAVAAKEYEQISGVLNKICPTFQVNDLLTRTLANPSVKESLLQSICVSEGLPYLVDELDRMPAPMLAKALIEGVPLTRDNLTNYLSQERYSLQPLYNFYFTRDASIAINNQVLIGKMATKVRYRETMIMEAIFKHSGAFSADTVNPNNIADPRISIEGGDVLIVRDDILLIGNGCRTTTQGIDFLLTRLMNRKNQKKFHIIVQELPAAPESFIHLDMVFTLLDVDKCMVYSPIVLEQNKYQTVHITVENGAVSISTVDSILSALKSLGISMEPIVCGGTKDKWNQEREQWHSGANFFAYGPGKVIGYARNMYTMDEMDKHGFEVIKAMDVISGKSDLASYQNKKVVVTIDGSELARGGGGARCMTMPVRRASVSW